MGLVRNWRDKDRSFVQDQHYTRFAESATHRLLKKAAELLKKDGPLEGLKMYARVVAAGRVRKCRRRFGHPPRQNDEKSRRNSIPNTCAFP